MRDISLEEAVGVGGGDASNSGQIGAAGSIALGAMGGAATGAGIGLRIGGAVGAIGGLLAY